MIKTGQTSCHWSGAYLMVGSGSNVYGGVDWVSVGLSAPEHVDLRNPNVRCTCTVKDAVVCVRMLWQASGIPNLGYLHCTGRVFGHSEHTLNHAPQSLEPCIHVYLSCGAGLDHLQWSRQPGLAVPQRVARALRHRLSWRLRRAQDHPWFRPRLSPGALLALTLGRYVSSLHEDVLFNKHATSCPRRWRCCVAVRLTCGNKKGVRIDRNDLTQAVRTA